eukprot:TRINITY_DN2013_c0_g1_i4.p3 TRINITY_DN2013_c0_g1~~TRINITY_DN2013_c0_g1_i4.p3  ORF type:complete len:111 (-),score=20.20 TRINITY_DN2013_c0_g1_i4:130-462(-)
MPTLQQSILNSGYNYLNTSIPKSEVINSNESSITLNYSNTVLDIGSASGGSSRKSRLEIEPLRANKTEESVEILQDERLGEMGLSGLLEGEGEEGGLKEKENLRSITEVD